MTDPEQTRIVSADRLKDSVVIGFSNGRVGRYSQELLHSMLDQAEELFERNASTQNDGDLR